MSIKVEALPDAALYRSLAKGHGMRSRHALDARLVSTDDGASWHVVRLCCGEALPTDSPTVAERLTDDVATYARTLIESGFTVYVMAKADRRPVGWFHYSRTVDGVERFGIFDDGSTGFEGASHRMPITPSRLNGSSAYIGGQWGDEPTLNLANLDPWTVEYAQAVARESNYCPENAEPTPEAVSRANAMQVLPNRFYGGAVLKNAQPWGIGTTYVAAVAQ